MRVADIKSRQIVPMRYFNLMLSPAEIEACTADYLEEAGRHADVARILLRTVAVSARIRTEIEEMKRSKNSLSIWKLHADSLAALLDIGKRLMEEEDEYLDQHGLASGKQPERSQVANLSAPHSKDCANASPRPQSLSAKAKNTHKMKKGRAIRRSLFPKLRSLTPSVCRTAPGAAPDPTSR